LKRTILIYALTLAALLLLLKGIEYRFLIRDQKVEIYVGVIAIICTILGAYAGWKLTSDKKTAAEEREPGIRILAEDSNLSPRELEVLALMAGGLSNQEIADKLFVSLNTVKKHCTSLFTKLDVKRRTQAIEKAKRMGLIS
jgi:two-component system, NarL family, response regulator LiaR